jgi:hypothetical protein
MDCNIFPIGIVEKVLTMKRAGFGPSDAGVVFFLF